MGRPPKLHIPADLKRILLSVGKNIRARREKLKISQVELSRRAKVSQTTLNEIESRSARDIRVSTLLLIAEKLGVSLSELFMESDLQLAKSNDHAQLLQASETILRIAKKATSKDTSKDEN